MARLRGFAAVSFAAVLLLEGLVASAQSGRTGPWSVAGGNPQHTGWQKGPTKIAKDSVAGELKFLWKLKLGDVSAGSNVHTEPLLIPNVGTSRGHNDLLLVGGPNSVYAVDSELATIFWEKHYDVVSAGQSKLTDQSSVCDGSSVSLTLSPPPNFRPDMAAAMAAIARGVSPTPPPPPDIPVDQRHIGNESGRAVYVLTGDGYLHAQILTNGADYASAVKFLPSPNGGLHSLTAIGKSLYTTTGHLCGGTSSGLWAVDLATPALSVTPYMTNEVSALGMDAPTIGTDGTLYLATGSGVSDPGAGVYANGVIALTPKDLKVKDWYTPPDAATGPIMNVTPVAFVHKGKDMVATPAENGRFVLLDSGSLGGPDHHTPLAETPPIAIAAESGAWGRLASWQDQDGADWVLAAIWGPVASGVKFGTTNGGAQHGSIVAFKVEDEDGQIVLTPSWVSRDITNPAPPVIVNGIIFALSGGDPTTRARLYALDGETGKELYSSGDSISTYTHLASLSVGGAHVFFTTHDNTLYCFGIAWEH